jgi:cysteine desulfurase
MIYLDYNATHPPFLDVLQKSVVDYGSNFANPSGISYPSQKNQARIEMARKRIARQLSIMHGLDADPQQLLFVSTGTEALHSLALAFSSTSKGRSTVKVLISPYEHESMVAACDFAGMQIELLPASQDGRVDPDSVRRRLAQGDIDLISVMAVCNETGALQPLDEIISIAQEFEVPVISDTIQAAGKLPLELKGLQGMVLNGHKIGAGYGTAVVWLADPDGYRPIFRGGLQENERRAGTENLISIISVPEAFDRQIEHSQSGSIRHDWHDRIEEMLVTECNARIAAFGSPRNSTTYAVFPAMYNMDFLLMALDREGILCSTGSSCKSRTRQPSQTLLRMGYSREESLQALRFSTGFFTTEEEIERFLAIFPVLYHRCL